MSTKAPPAHPKYEVMIAEAIKSLKDRTGSSSPAIAKYLETTYGSSLPPNWKKVLAVQLKRLADNGKLVKVGWPRPRHPRFSSLRPKLTPVHKIRFLKYHLKNSV
jgi:histone H1/5